MEPATAFNFLSLILVGASVAGTWMVFVKAGYQGWKAVIPFYNYYILLRITRHSGWWLATFVVPALLIFLAGSTVQYQLVELTTQGARNLVEAISLLILIAAPVAITVNAVVMYDLARAFGKRLPFTVGLTLFPFIFLVWLGFGDEVFQGLEAGKDNATSSNDSVEEAVAHEDAEDKGPDVTESADGTDDEAEAENTEKDQADADMSESDELEDENDVDTDDDSDNQDADHKHHSDDDSEEVSNQSSDEHDSGEGDESKK